LDECEIHQTYIDTLFSFDSDIETFMYEVTLSVPLKTHRNLMEYGDETDAIEKAVIEAGQSDGIYVRSIDWRPYLKSEHNKQADRKAAEITQLLTQEYVNKQIRLMNSSIESNPHL